MVWLEKVYPVGVAFEVSKAWHPVQFSQSPASGSRSLSALPATTPLPCPLGTLTLLNCKLN